MSTTVSVIGAGTMGAALVQKFAMEGFNVCMVDANPQALTKGMEKITSMLQEGVDKKAFKEDYKNAALQRIQFGSDFALVSQSDWVIEAIYENMEAKIALFRELAKHIAPHCIVATNTSSFSVNEMAAQIPYAERFLGLHYFYHAAKNRLVEIIPGQKTSQEVCEKAFAFCLESGKDPIFTADRYGFAVNRFFVPWLNEACKLASEGYSHFQIDSIASEWFGIGMGPFALMNATGVPIAMHAQKTLEIFGPSYQTSPYLIQQVQRGQNWDITPQERNWTAEAEKTIIERLAGQVFFVCAQILDEKVCTATDLNKGARIGLKWKKGPMELMLETGEENVKQWISSFCRQYEEKLPSSVSAQLWQPEWVNCQIFKHHALITMNRPEDLNALNETVMGQLDKAFELAHSNPHIETIFLTGTGKAFVAGADIKFFVHHMQQKSIKDIVSFTAYGQAVFEKIASSPKKVIAIVNGLCLGGGLELALCADEIWALPNTKMAFPETGIGIYPGLGGTQRSRQKVGKSLAKYLIFTGKMLNSTDALNIGLIDSILPMEDYYRLWNGYIPAKPDLKKSGNQWENWQVFFDKVSLQDILQNKVQPESLSPEELSALQKQIARKAPIALKIADRLIEEAKGTASELAQLETIFNTKDAWLGLNAIGQSVSFTGE